jgi:uncharacterized membrane protein/mono/diheme cytochrome c family protein
MEQETTDFILFLGRFHVLILHLPIGFLIIAFILELLSRFVRFKKYKPAAGLVLTLGAVSAVITAVLGLMLSRGGGYNEDLLTIHQWSGIMLVITAVAAVLLYWQRERKFTAQLDRAYLTSLWLMMISLFVTGHFGGSLTHGSEYITQYMPNGLRKIAGLAPKKTHEIKKITNLDEALIYADIIQPILETRCNSCHNNSKSKGGLRMHTLEGLMRGGESGPVFVAGNVAESEMMIRIHLPEHDEEHMPPKGKRQLTDEQINLLAWWIREGAPFDKTVAEVTVDEKAQLALNTLLDQNAKKSEVEKLLISNVQPADEQVLDNLKEQGVKVMPLAMSTHWLQTSIPPGGSADSLLNSLLMVSDQVTWLDLRSTPTTDHGLSFIAQFKNLTRLHLNNTEISGKGLHHLGNLPYLEYLNLYGTRVNDKDIQQLAGLKNLKRLYLWQTQVTEEGAAQLQKSLPGLQVNLGIGNGEVAQ